MRTITPIILALLLALAPSACARVAEPGPGPLGTERQPTAPPEEVQEEAPLEQEEPSGLIQ